MPSFRKTVNMFSEKPSVQSVEPEVTPIRICATDFPYVVVFTWYRSGEIWKIDRLTGSALYIDNTYSRDGFNRILLANGLRPVGYGRIGKKVDYAQDS